MKSLKELAADLLAARSKVLNAEDDALRARQAYIAAEAAYLTGMGDNFRSIVFQSTTISLSRAWPDSRIGDHLEFETIEVLS